MFLSHPRLENGSYQREFDVADCEGDTLRRIEWTGLHSVIDRRRGLRYIKKEMWINGCAGALLGIVLAFFGSALHQPTVYNYSLSTYVKVAKPWGDVIHDFMTLSVWLGGFGCAVGLIYGTNKHKILEHQEQGLIHRLTHNCISVYVGKTNALMVQFESYFVDVWMEADSAETHLTGFEFLSAIEYEHKQNFPLDAFKPLVVDNGAAYGLPQDNHVIYVEPLGLERHLIAMDVGQKVLMVELRNKLNHLLLSERPLLEEWAKEWRNDPEHNDGGGEPDYPDM